MGVFQKEEFKGQTVKMAKVLMRQFEPYLYTRYGENKALFIADHSTSLFAPLDDSKRPDSAELGKTYDELMNTYRILEQIVNE